MKKDNTNDDRDNLMKNEINLRDQLGSMAIIDTLYARQLAIDEHLNLHSLRKNIEERIRQYYKNAGFQVSDELIEEGVKSWFDNRLRYTAPKLSFKQRFIAYLYIKSGKWLKVLGVIGLIAVLSLISEILYERNQTLSLKNYIAEETNTTKTLEQQAQQIPEQLNQYKTVTFVYANKSADRLIEQAQTLLDKFNAEKIPPATISDSSSREQLIQYFNVHKLNNQQQGLLLEQISQIQQNLAKLLKFDRALSELTQQANFNNYVARSLQLSNAVATAALSLEQNSDSISNDINMISLLIKQEDKRQDFYNQLNHYSENFRALKLSTADQKEVNNQLSALRLSIDGVDMTNIRSRNILTDEFKKLKYTLDYIKTPLTFMVVDRVGEKSGVERTYDRSGGKSWYMIAEALTDRGTPFPVLIKDSETGVEKQVRTFGIRITQSEYEKLRADKLDDGHINNKLIGKKPANQLGIHYSRPLLDERITKW